MADLSFFQPRDTQQLAERIFSTAIDGLYYVDSPVHADERGFYRETALIPDLSAVIGRQFVVKQLNHARSERHVIRGFHAENWHKLVTITHGTALCVLVDIRQESPTYLQKEYIKLGIDPQDQSVLSGSLFISAGIANSVCVMAAPVDYIYAVDQLYRERDTSFDQAISIFDPELAIEWPIPREQIIQSERDKNAVLIKEL
jgi:dTDP-4-dehydrorhamnose 3,5-epimerase